MNQKFHKKIDKVSFVVKLLFRDSAVITTAILLLNQIFHFQWLFEAKTKKETSRLVFCTRVLCV